jgi:hypothetical protein
MTVLRIDPGHQGRCVFMTAPDSGRRYSGYLATIFMKSSPMGGIAFPNGCGTPVIRDIPSPNRNNATSTKQSVSSATGMAVIASNDATQRHWHADVPLGSS